MNKENEGMADVRIVPAELNGLWGFVDKNGAIIVEYQFDEAREFHEGLAAVRKGTKWGYINEKGEIVQNIVYEYVEDMHQGFGIVDDNDGWSTRYYLVNRTGKLLPGVLGYDCPPSIIKGVARVTFLGLINYVNPRGEEFDTIEEAIQSLVSCQDLTDY